MKKRTKSERDPSTRKRKLGFVRCFLKDFLDNMSDSSVKLFLYLDIFNRGQYGDFWYRTGEGFILLERKELENYREVCQKLLKEFSKEGSFSKSAIDSALKTAVFEFIDISKCRNPDPSVRLDEALENLWKFLNRPHEEYECYIEVGGFRVASLPARFGDVRFVVFSNYQLGKLKRIIRTSSTGNTSNKLEVINTSLNPLLNHSVAIVRVEALDSQAAKTLAERKVRTTIESLNFFSGIVPSNNAGLFLPTERRSNSIRGFIVAIKSRRIKVFEMSDTKECSHGPTVSFSIAKLRQSKSPIVRSAAKRVDSLLKGNKNKVEKLTLRSVCWGGRATTEKTREESFLLFAVALECLVLPGDDNRELGYRLSQRVAQLLSKDALERKELMEKTKKLYNVRSKIVHSGHYEVTEEEHNEIHSIAKSVIFKLLANRYVQGFSNSKELEDWLKELSLK